MLKCAWHLHLDYSDELACRTWLDSKAEAELALEVEQDAALAEGRVIDGHEIVPCLTDLCGRNDTPALSGHTY
jgi:hypothetical protein